MVRITAFQSCLLVVNVHLEPNTTIRELRRRVEWLRALWPSFRHGLGILTGGPNNCEADEGGFCVASQSFSNGDAAIDHAFIKKRLADARDFRCRVQVGRLRSRCSEPIFPSASPSASLRWEITVPSWLTSLTQPSSAVQRT